MGARRERKVCRKLMVRTLEGSIEEISCTIQHRLHSGLRTVRDRGTVLQYRAEGIVRFYFIYSNWSSRLCDLLGWQNPPFVGFCYSSRKIVHCTNPVQTGSFCLCEGILSIDSLFISIRIMYFLDKWIFASFEDRICERTSVFVIYAHASVTCILSLIFSPIHRKRSSRKKK